MRLRARADVPAANDGCAARSSAAVTLRCARSAADGEPSVKSPAINGCGTTAAVAVGCAGSSASAITAQDSASVATRMWTALVTLRCEVPGRWCSAVLRGVVQVFAATLGRKRPPKSVTSSSSAQPEAANVPDHETMTAARKPVSDATCMPTAHRRQRVSEAQPAQSCSDRSCRPHVRIRSRTPTNARAHAIALGYATRWDEALDGGSAARDGKHGPRHGGLELATAECAPALQSVEVSSRAQKRAAHGPSVAIGALGMRRRVWTGESTTRTATSISATASATGATKWPPRRLGAVEPGGTPLGDLRALRASAPALRGRAEGTPTGVL